MPSKPAQTDVIKNRGIAALGARDFPAASRAFKNALAKSPNDPTLLYLMGVTELEQGRLRPAIRFLEKAIRLAPKYAEAYNSLGVAFNQSQDGSRAIEAFSRAVAHDPDSFQARLNLAHTLNEANKSDRALAHFQHLADLRPADSEIRYLLGNTRLSMGDHDGAKADFRAVLADKPSHGGAWMQLAILDEINIETDRELLENALATHADAPGEKAKIALSISRAYERAGDFDQAARYLVEGNDLRASLTQYNIEDVEANIADIAGVFSSAPVVTAEKSSRPVRAVKVVPIFVVGMPRSGTTLIEQILASHSAVYGAGECNSVGPVISHRATGTSHYPHSAANWRTKDYGKIGEEISSHLSELANGAAFVVDKTPQNFYYLGLIQRALPQARIIHCVRDPIDTAFSNYRQYFNSGNEYTYNQENLVRFMRAVQNLMAHWRRVMGDGFVDVRYEDMIADQAGQTKRLLEYCGLPWEDACLDFHKSRRPVQTPSVVQVRQPIYATSLGSWQPYADHIKTLIEGLSDGEERGGV